MKMDLKILKVMILKIKMMNIQIKYVIIVEKKKIKMVKISAKKLF